MADQQSFFDWQQSISETYGVVVQHLSDRFPQVIGAIAILLIGLLVAYLLRFAARKLTLAAEALILGTTRETGIARAAERSYSGLVGNITFWSVLLFFMAASANMLDWQIFSDFLGTLLTYLPHLFAGLLIILAGFVLGGVARSLIETAAATAGIARPDLPARIAQVAVVMTALIIGIEQLGINITFLTTTFIVIAGVLLSGAALAFGLGAKHFVANLIGAQISQKHYQVGQWVKLGDIEGYLLEITQTALVLDTERGRAVVPASRLQRDISEILAKGNDGGGDSGSLFGNLFRRKEDSDGTA